MMTHSQESLVSSSQDAFGFSEESKPISGVSALVKLLKTNAYARSKMGMDMPLCLSIEDDSDNKQSFPWLSKFSQLSKEAVGSQSIKLLESLISVYLRSLSEDVQLCYKKPKRAGKLKTKMNDALKLFHMLYSDIKKPLEYTFYLDKMAELMAMYMDMEIKASRRSKEIPKKISERLTSSLFIFLDNSPDHILDSILKAKFFTKRFKDICIPILIRILRDNPGRILYEMTYIRYLLCFKLWKKLVEKKEARIEINKLAVAKLIPPFDFLDKLRSGQFSGILPYVAKSEKDRITAFLMQAPFNVKEKAEVFLKACRDPKEGMLVVHPGADLGKSLFFSEDMKFSSEPDPEVNGSSMSLMNSIWSSMANTDDSGPGDCFRLCSELSLEPKKNKKGCKRLKEKCVKAKSDVTIPNEKAKKKKKCKDQLFTFVHETKPKVEEMSKVKELLKPEEKDNSVLKIKTEKLFEEIENINALQSKIDNLVSKEPPHVSKSIVEETTVLIKKDLDIAGNSGSTFKEPEIDAVSDVIRTIKLDIDKEPCVLSKQTIITNQRDTDVTVVSSSICKEAEVSYVNASDKTSEGLLSTNYRRADSKVNLDLSCIDLDKPINEPNSSNKTVDVDTVNIKEPTVIKTETVDDSNCVVINDDDDEQPQVQSSGLQMDRIGGESFDLCKIAHEIEIGSESLPEHIQNDRLDSLLENDISQYPTIPGSESFNTSKDIQNDMQPSFSRDICIADQFLQLPSFFEGNEDVVSQVLCDWPTNQGNFGLYKEHDNSYLPTVLLRSDINFGVLFPEVSIDNEEEEEEIHYQGQGQYARGAKVAFGDMATAEDHETEWETRDQEYEESSPSRDDSNRSVSESSTAVINSIPLTPVKTVPQCFVMDQSPSLAEEKTKKLLKISDDRKTYEINGGYDLSKFQQVSVNLKQVAYDIPDKELTKGTLPTPDAIKLHDRTVFRDHYNFVTQLRFRNFYLSVHSPAATPIPYPVEMSPQTHLPITRCSCSLCHSNFLALVSNFNHLVQYRNFRLENEAEFKKNQDEELLRKIEESLTETKPIKKEDKDGKPASTSDASLPLKKRKAITHINLKQEVSDPSNCQGSALNEHIHSSSKRAKKIKKHKSSEIVCTKNSQTEYLKREKTEKVPISVPLMKVVYTSPEGNKLKVKTLAQRKETYNTPPVNNLPHLSSDSEEGSDTQKKKFHRHRHRTKRTKQEKRERKERRRLKKLLKS